MKFVIDNQLRATLAQFLRERGSDCVHVLDIALSDSSDIAICRYAIAESRVVVSKDEDFFYLANQLGFRLIWVRLGNCRTHALLVAFERACPQIEIWFRSKEGILEVR